MSKTYSLPVIDGITQGYDSSEADEKNHALSFDIKGGAPAGTITIKGRFPGASYFEAIPDATNIPLNAPYSVQFTGPVAEYQITLAGVSGLTALSMTDSTES